MSTLTPEPDPEQVFAHLCIYDVNPEGGKGHSVSHVHEMHPDGDSGAIQVSLGVGVGVGVGVGAVVRGRSKGL
jgi:hypothetical protein